MSSEHSALRNPNSALWPGHPPTIIVVHPKERRSKCSVEPLRGRSGFEFRTFPERGRESLTDYMRLGIGGPLLSEADADRGLLVLDGTWRYAQAMEHDYAEIPVRSLPAWQTAYPRRSKVFDDPDIGLATIEAIFAAHVALGRPTEGLLNEYRWADDFLRLNAEFVGSAVRTTINGDGPHSGPYN